jgi:hypothetical protein
VRGNAKIATCTDFLFVSVLTATTTPVVRRWRRPREEVNTFFLNTKLYRQTHCQTVAP